MKNCPCIFKQQMIAEILKLPEQHPDGLYAWVNPLFGNAPEDSPCCLLTLLFYYAYCKECPVPLSEEARAVLKPLMESTE